MNRKLLIALALMGVAGSGFLLVRSYKTNPPTVAPPTVVEANDPSVFGVFEGRIPCDDCERVKVRLILHQDRTAKTPTNYTLERIYVGKSNERHITSGAWTVTAGTKTDSRAAVYRLNAEPGFAIYQAVDKNVLLFLNDDLSLKIGDAAHSYTLSRTL